MYRNRHRNGNDDLNDKVAMTKAQHISHRLDIVSETKPTKCDTPFMDAVLVTTVEAAPDTTDASSPFRKPFKYLDIYVDDNLWTCIREQVGTLCSKNNLISSPYQSVPTP